MTIRTGGHTALEAAVREKQRKYAAAMSSHPHLALTIFGISHTGGVSADAKETLSRWATCLSRTRRSHADLPGNPTREIRSAFGLAFATVMTLQAAAYVADVDARRRGEGVLE